MQNHLIKSLIHACQHTARHEWRHGNHSRAAGVCMIGLGLVMLPIPFIGLPLIIAGIAKFARS